MQTYLREKGLWGPGSPPELHLAVGSGCPAVRHGDWQCVSARHTHACIPCLHCVLLAHMVALGASHIGVTVSRNIPFLCLCLEGIQSSEFSLQVNSPPRKRCNKCCSVSLEFCKTLGFFLKQNQVIKALSSFSCLMLAK